MKEYPKYKNSNTDYLVEIPVEWGLGKIKFQGKVVSGSTPETNKTDFWDGEIVWATPVDFGNEAQKYIINSQRKITTAGLKNIGGKLVPKGSIVISSRAPIGLVAIAGVDLSTNQGCKSVIPQKAVGEYLYYCLKEFSKVLENYGNETIFAELSMNTLKNFFLPIPPKTEQTQIVKYLDYKTGLIDDFISSRKKQIDLLREQKTSIINKAVTKGIGLDATMKSSGVKWIGDIPIDWQVMDLKRLINPKRPITYGIVQPGEEDLSGRFMIRGQDYSQGWAKPETIFRVSDEVEIPYKRARVIKGDILITIVGAGCGNIAVVPDWLDGANLTQTTARIAIDQRYHIPDFFYYVLTSKIGVGNVEMYVKGAAQPGLNIGYIKVFKLTVPPKEIQTQIVKFIVGETGKLEDLITKYQKQIELMQEYKTAIISQAVTGKIDVREWKPKAKELVLISV